MKIIIEKLGNINDVNANSTVVSIVNTVVQDAMGFVMIVTAILMAVVFILTLRLHDKKLIDVSSFGITLKNT